MFEITRRNCYKCDLETIILLNDGQYFWINIKDFEAETACSQENIFTRHGNSSTLKYRKELTPNIKFQPYIIFARNDLFEKIFKSCKATDAEFLILKEKLGICPYNEKEITLMPEIQDDIVQVKKQNKESAKTKVSECPKEDENKESMKIKDENATAWYHKNEFEKILRIVNSNKFSHKNKTGRLRYNDISNLINNINNNAISKIQATENLNKLNEIKKVEMKGKRLLNGQKELLNFFNMLLNAIFTENNNNNDNGNNDSDSVNEENEEENGNDSVNGENEEENEEENGNDSVNDNDDDDDGNGWDKIKQINNYFKRIDKTKSLEEQINVLKKEISPLDDWFHTAYHDDDKEINFKIFKLKSADILKDHDENLFEEIFDHIYAALANKVINTTNKKENQIITKDIRKSMDILYEHDNFHNYVIHPTQKRLDLIDAAKIILRFNETVQLDGD